MRGNTSINHRGICCSQCWRSASQSRHSICSATDCGARSMCAWRTSDVDAVSILSAHDFTVSARLDDTVVPAIRGLSFDLAPSKILGLVGESGAGKSMVGRAIAQLLPPGFAVTGGSLSFEGRDFLAMAPA